MPSDVEFDADVYGFLLSLGAGCDPYAIGGAFGKLMVATGTSALEAQQAQAASGDPHGSFDDRIAIIFQDITAVCQSPSFASTCAMLKGAFHPHLPSMDPMIKTSSEVIYGREDRQDVWQAQMHRPRPDSYPPAR